MRYIISILFVAVIASSGALLFSADVKAQGCAILLDVETIPESETEFPFTVTGAVTEEFTLQPLGIGKAFLLINETVTVTQGAVDGWVLRDIDCEFGEEDDVTTTIVNSGVTIACDGNANATCTFINSRTETIPTLSEWGAIALVLGFGVVGYFVIRRRQVTA